ncbi:helix-turn-helix domain-containing protein [Paenibacillus spongiae]|uniref:Helix-turn-helix domain-containing protein n=1 Tax=Paenibacillus spongiae TaxID=2909671 RepID=A0ABY5S9Q5_9BACL|nr:helix-turn-helix domain-containing protein [Paenibacillus spongiae]UVI30469.1 helix-turn-helix domain-containing protein [Paenibacillus spongiae]
MEAFKVRTSMYKRLLISFVTIIIALILVLSSILYYNYSSSSISLLKNMKADILSQTSYSAVYMDTISKRFCQSLSLNHSIIAFANSNQDDILITGKAIRTLSALAIPNTYIHSVYVYNKKIDTLISTPSDTFYSSPDFFDQDIVGMLNHLQNKEMPILYPIPRKIANPEGANAKFSNVYTYVLFDTINPRKAFNNAIVLNIDADWLRRTISSIDSKMNSEGSELLVANESGIIVNHSSPDQFMKNIADQDYFIKARSSASSSGSFFGNLDHRKYVISYVSSKDLGWTFLSMTPYKSVFASVQRNGVITLVFCLIVLLLGLFYAYLASKKLYRPIGALTDGIKQRLKPENRPEQSMDEVGFLASAFHGIIDKTAYLEDMKRNSAPLLKNEYLKNILSGQVVLPLGIPAAFEKELNIHLNLRHAMFLILLKIDGYKSFVEKHNEMDRSLYKYAIANIAKEVTSEYFSNEVIDTSADQLAVLADVKAFPGSLEPIYDAFHAIVSRIQDNVRRHLNISLSGTLGFRIESPEQIKSVYEETLNLSMYRIVYGHSSIITPDILKKVDWGRFKFPTSKEKQLIDSLKLGNGNAAKIAYQEIIQSIERTPYDNIMSSSIYLFFSIYNSLNQIVADTPSRFNDLSIDFLHKATGLETLEEMEVTFFELIDDIILLKDGTKDRKKNEIVNRVTEHIQKNYSDKNLSLNSCAESLSLSTVYLGKLFKNATGKSVAEYITAVRMEKIKHYLEQSSMPINNILEECGMEKSNYFYTSFKKYFGVSLTEYRLKSANTGDE